jgi:hypothetical protein
MQQSYKDFSFMTVYFSIACNISSMTCLTRVHFAILNHTENMAKQYSDINSPLCKQRTRLEKSLQDT